MLLMQGAEYPNSSSEAEDRLWAAWDQGDGAWDVGGMEPTWGGGYSPLFGCEDDSMVYAC
jgi:hypothetical protein